ncbi:MAG: GSCFA domain-containing protein [Frankiaceae bacterium]|nr:GSCFA domain-containing protein [Frankiaceae bacterium]
MASQSATHLPGVYVKKFALGEGARIAAAGSCFAQHIVRQLRIRNFNVVDVEPPPPGIEGATARRFGYLTYSARYGNIYTARQLVQLIEEATGVWQPVDWVWERNGRFFDALRPSVEPEGLSTQDLVRAHRDQHLAAVREMIKSTDVFVFTLGLTEAWMHRASGTVYPTAPGTVAGSFNKDFSFINFSTAEVVRDLYRARALLQAANPSLRMILTVSPVPLTATATDDHVLLASSYSKAVLRAAAGELAQKADVDYFPSYEIITGPQARGQFFDENLRTVRAEGVAVVMSHFFAQHAELQPAGRAAVTVPPASVDELMDDQCEDALLEMFGS